MVISASRRTDIPAFYSEWLMERLRAGFCLVPNPMNAKQVSRISLVPADVDCIVFWTKDSRPLLPHLPEIDAMGYRYYFQFTVNGYPRELEPRAPSMSEAVAAFALLSERIGPQRCLWRYDPIVLTSLTDVNYHEQRLQLLFSQLSHLTDRLTVSVVDFYRKSGNRLRQLAEQDILLAPDSERLETYFPVLRIAAELASAHSIEIVSCAEDPRVADLGIRPGKCIDDAVIRRACSVIVSGRKDPTQREECGCVFSRDIGMFDTCLHGCTYCYATVSQQAAERRHAKHHPDSPCLIGRPHVSAESASVLAPQQTLPLQDG